MHELFELPKKSNYVPKDHFMNEFKKSKNLD